MGTAEATYKTSDGRVTARLPVVPYSRMVPVAEMADPANDYNLNILRYIDSSDRAELASANSVLRQ